MNDKMSVVDVCVNTYICDCYFYCSFFIIRSRVLTWSERGNITGENDIMGFKIFNLRLILLEADPSGRAV